ncbi:FAD-binding oxidoreductase [Halosimplex litoreum]|uniref:D-lactate dehydrogenase (cytochrome) n=1 Tax=Halosimplex litoreum TaxID=1198301 RepID=A0A7T3KTQ4_9EURY|nr:FAD-binding oxidoreductase [Halosimplex litoreum]QPV61482.1 FAD-binding oxidoreductase [Halosimplex litoreum]
MTDLDFLRDAVGPDRVSTDEYARDEHAGDWGTHPEDEVRPDAVVWPTSTEEVSAVLAGAHERGTPVTPYAAGTGLEGNAVPAHEGISMDLTRMDGILDLRPDDLQIDVEPGVLGSAVDEAAAEHGLTFPPLPSSGDISTIGGMIATDASGMQAVKYGVVADWVLELEAVLADGTVITAGSKAVKSSAGYNLKDLIVGSEGTLAVVTRATLQLAGRPQQIKGGRAVFETFDDAAGAIADAVQSGVDVAKIELMGGFAAEVANEYVGTDLPDAPMVFVEFHADHGIDEEIEFCRTVFADYDPHSFEIAADEEMAQLWELRREMAYALDEYREDLRPLHPGDVTVPIGSFPEIVRRARAEADERDLPMACYGHAGDGNLHYEILVDPDDAAMVERGEAAYAAVVEAAIDLGGTATGEHGVGLGKRQFMEREHGAESVAAMRSIKTALDPEGILNPGKIFPDEPE